MSLPDVPKATITALLFDRYGITTRALKPLPGYEDRNVCITSDTGAQYVLKISAAGTDVHSLEAQHTAMAWLEGRALSIRSPTPVPTLEGHRLFTIQRSGLQHPVRLLTFLPGVPMLTLSDQSPALLRDLGRRLGELDAALMDFSHPGTCYDSEWDVVHTLRSRSHLDTIADAHRRRLLESLLLQFELEALPALSGLRWSVIHNDANEQNVLVDPDAPDAIVGLIDFGDLVRTCTIAELAIATAYAMLSKDDPVAAGAEVVAGYHGILPLTDTEIAVLPALISARLCTSVLQSAAMQKIRPDDPYLTVSATPAWRLLEQLVTVPDLRERLDPTPSPPPIDLPRLRAAHIGPSLRLQSGGLHITRGIGAHLYATDGRAYLDLVNNVCHVGHSHPAVVRAAARQWCHLNTNTRYHYAPLVRYAARLCATLPESLSVCFFVCSGSEANELALRIARTVTDRQDVAIIDGAYHGNTAGLIDVSPYKHNGPGGSGQPPGVHVVPTPDPYRGMYRGEGIGPRYAAHLSTLPPLAAFLSESLLGCGGQIPLPPGYLAAAFETVRAQGGLCICDEVQVGFGRVGHSFWGFQGHGVVPDIVTMGKPMGNGHPLAAVVTTPRIAAAFDQGMEYFNTFGGNPVSCAVGLAVLDVIEREGLQQHAALVGGQLKSGLAARSARHPAIGDVRGEGLFLGVELVSDPERRIPDATRAVAVVAKMQAAGILIGRDGPDGNVLKIKPPMVITASDADRVLTVLDDVLLST